MTSRVSFPLSRLQELQGPPFTIWFYIKGNQGPVESKEDVQGHMAWPGFPEPFAKDRNKIGNIHKIRASQETRGKEPVW